MAFKKINPSSVSELLLEVVNFCKNDLNWNVAQQSGQQFIFQPFVGAETFTIKDIVSILPAVAREVAATPGSRRRRSDQPWKDQDHL